MDFITNIQYWHWFIIGFAFIVFEVFAPGAILLWFGVSAAFMGFLVLALPEMSWEMQFGLWGFLSLAAVLISRRYLKFNPIKTDQPTLNQRGSQYVDRVFTLDEPVVNGYGKIKVDDSTWKIQAEEDFKKGTKVKVTGTEGTMLIVEKNSD